MQMDKMDIGSRAYVPVKGKSCCLFPRHWKILLRECLTAFQGRMKQCRRRKRQGKLRCLARLVKRPRQTRRFPAASYIFAGRWLFRGFMGRRVYQAVEAAGGFLSQADEGYLNLAAPVYDGMKITVYTREEAKTAPAPEALGAGLSGKQEGKESGAKVNINTAGKEELLT